MDLTSSLRSHKAQLFATAVTASLVTAGAITAYQSYSKANRRKKLAREINDAVANKEKDKHALSIETSSPEIDYDVVGSLEQWELQRQMGNAAREAKSEEYDEDLIREQLARCYARRLIDDLPELRYCQYARFRPPLAVIMDLQSLG